MASSKRKKDGDRKKGNELNVIGVPRVYRKRKTYGAGGKQVAWEEFDHPRKLDQTELGRSIVYTLDPAFAGEPVVLTITHNDGTSQEWRIVSEGEAPGTTHSVHVCYDDQGRPTSIYIE
ncbi:MAG TPA: hypothetical protein VM686_37875 [Polyangiaceae bacterium]|jgi:hypothetical protein|nr:hypothetical protein [Polyangiaceae bacterium]